MARGTTVRTLRGRYGEYILVDDLRYALQKDLTNAVLEGRKSTACFIDQLIERLEKMRDA